MKIPDILMLCLCLLSLSISLNACKESPQKLTENEVIQFAMAIQVSIHQGNAQLLDDAISQDVFLKRLNLPNSPTARGFAKGIMNTAKMGTQIISTLKNFADFEFVKQYQKNGRHHIIYRIFTDEGGLNYHDYELLKEDGKCKIADVYVYITGENLSETISTMYKTMFPTGTASSDINVDGFKRVKEVKNLMVSGNNTEAKILLDALPPLVKNTKSVMILDVVICANLTPDEYTNAINDFNLQFPNEPNMDLLMLDNYVNKKDYRSLLASVNALDAKINKDPVLDYHRYLSYNLLGKSDSSMVYLLQLVKNKPEFQRGILELIAVYLEEDDKKSSDSLISIYRDTKKFNQKSLHDLLESY